MNRQKMLNKLQKYYDWNYDNEEYDLEVEEKHKQNLEYIIKYLKQPISLVDFLGWEEDVEYNVFDERYKVVNNELYWFNDRYNEWIKSDYDEELINFQQAKKIQPKKYYLKLKEKYRNFYRFTKDFDYLNFYKNTNYFFVSNSTSFDEYQVQFTLEEIEEVKKIDFIPFEQFELIEVGEDE